MKVKVHGFEWSVGADTTLTEFMNFLKSENGQEKGHEIVGVTLNGNYWAGVYIAIKNARAYFQYKKRSKGFEVSVQELEAGTSIVDINFFILHASTGRGLYQSYYQSGNLGTFGNHCVHRYLSFKTLFQRKGWLKQSILVKPETIESYTAGLELLKSFVVEYASYTYPEKEFEPVAKEATRLVYRAVFDKRVQRRKKVKDAVIGFLRKRKDALKKARITGVDTNGQVVNYQLVNDPDVFLEYDYDEFYRNVTLNTDDLEGTIDRADSIARLIKLANTDKVKQLLTAKTK